MVFRTVVQPLNLVGSLIAVRIIVSLFVALVLTTYLDFRSRHVLSARP